MGCEHLLSLLESWSLVPSLTNFKLVWKMAALLGLVKAKGSDLTFLHIDIQCRFLQHHTIIFVPAPGGKTD